MFRVGYFLEVDDLKVNKESLLRPFLFNVFMHDFDQFMEILESQSIDAILLFTNKNCGFFDVKNLPSPIVCKYPYQTIQMFNASSRHNKKYFAVWGRSAKNQYIQYVRYSNNLLVGGAGSRKFLIYLKKEINDYLKSNLHLKASKHESINKDQPSISFLGHEIQLVYFHQKMRTKNKRLEVMYRHKNKVMQRLRLEKYKINRFQMNKFKKKVLQHVEVILAALDLSFVKKSKEEVSASLFAYKLFGDVLAKIVRFSHLKGLMSRLFLLFDSDFVQDSMPPKWYKTVDNNV